MRSEWFPRHSTVRDADHYRRMFAASNMIVGARLAAKGVYAARYGEYGDAADDDLLHGITRHLIARYGETLSAAEATAEIDAARR